MGAAAETLKTLNKFRIGFMRLFRKLRIDGIFFDDPKITDDGYIIATVYPADENGNKLQNSKIVFQIKFQMNGELFSDVSFLPEGKEAKATKPLKGPFTEEQFKAAIKEYKRKNYKDTNTTDPFKSNSEDESEAEPVEDEAEPVEDEEIIDDGDEWP